MLIVKLFLFSSIGDQVFDHLPVHQRLSAKKIHFQIPAASGIGNQKIQRSFSHFITHQRPAAMIFSFFRKTVAAGKIAVMGDMQTKRLHHRLLRVRNLLYIVLVNIFCIKLSRGDQFFYILCRLI